MRSLTPESVTSTRVTSLSTPPERIRPWWLARAARYQAPALPRKERT